MGQFLSMLLSFRVCLLYLLPPLHCVLRQRENAIGGRVGKDSHVENFLAARRSPLAEAAKQLAVSRRPDPILFMKDHIPP